MLLEESLKAIHEMNKQEQLFIALRRAKTSWQARSYDSIHLERRRDNFITRISQLILAYNDKGELNPNQIKLAEKLIEDTNKKESEL